MNYSDSNSFDCPVYEVKIPDTIEEIGSTALAGGWFKEITIPASVKKMDFSLYWSFALEKINLPDSFTEVPSGLASCCKYLKECPIPESVKYIRDEAFFRCYSMTDVFIPANVEVIEDRAFAAMTGIEAFRVSPDNKFFAVKDGILLSKDGKRLVAWPFKNYDVKVPEGIETIDRDALNWIFNLDKIDLPSTLKDISGVNFYYDWGLKEITVRNETPLECDKETADKLFYEDVYEKAVLYVPYGSEESYRNVLPWSRFKNIQPIHDDGVGEISAEDGEVEYYRADGVRVTEPREGELLIRRQGGKSEKIIF